MPLHEVLDRLLQAVEGELEHGENLRDHPDRPGVAPGRFRLGIDPHGVPEGPGEELQALLAALALPLAVLSPFRSMPIFATNSSLSNSSYSAAKRINSDTLINANN